MSDVVILRFILGICPAIMNANRAKKNNPLQLQTCRYHLRIRLIVTNHIVPENRFQTPMRCVHRLIFVASNGSRMEVNNLYKLLHIFHEQLKITFFFCCESLLAVRRNEIGEHSKVEIEKVAHWIRKRRLRSRFLCLFRQLYCDLQENLTHWNDGMAISYRLKNFSCGARHIRFDWNGFLHVAWMFVRWGGLYGVVISVLQPEIDYSKQSYEMSVFV